jgi:hypothetical protein
VIGMKVSKEYICHGEGNVIAHHLTLRALTAIEQQRLALPHDRERGDVALHRRARRGSAEEAKGE